MLEPRVLDLLRSVRDAARREGIQAEFGFHRERSSLIRLGNSSVALSTYEDLTRFSVTVYQGRRKGSFGMVADLVSEEQLRGVLRRAQENCAAALEMEYEPIFRVIEAEVHDASGFDPALAELSPEAKSDLCASVIRATKPRGAYDFSGSWSSGATEIYLSSTANERECIRRLTDSKLLMVLKEQERKWELSVDAGGKTADSVSADAVRAAFDRLLPIYEARPGYRAPLERQRVLFGPEAIAELVGLAVWGGFHGRGWIEQRAFTSGKDLGAVLFSPQVTLKDDPSDANVFGMPFDSKGRRRKPFLLAEEGVFSAVMIDSATAAKYGKQPTGHDVGSMDLVLLPGDAPAGLAEGMKLAGEALYIPHLHYTHMPDPSIGQFTGSSRFNALRVEGGEPTAPLFSTRVTDTIPSVLSHVVAVSSRSVMVNISSTYGSRSPEAVSVPEYVLCDNVRINDVADGF